MNLGLKDKTAIVCGASQGLGRACAEALAAEGASLVMCSRNFDRIFQAARSISETYGATAVPIAADLTQPDTPDKLVREAVAKFGVWTYSSTTQAGRSPDFSKTSTMSRGRTPSA